jgi:hypothetical protein
MIGVDRNLAIIYNECSEKIALKNLIHGVFSLLTFQEATFSETSKFLLI